MRRVLSTERPPRTSSGNRAGKLRARRTRGTRGRRALLVIALVGALAIVSRPRPMAADGPSTPHDLPGAHLLMADATSTGTPAPGTPATPSPSGAAYAGTIAVPGVSPIVWLGGTDPTARALALIVQRAGAASATVFDGGRPCVLIPGAPDTVNAAFLALFPGGVIPSGTIVFVTTTGIPLERARELAAPIARGMSGSPVTFLSARSGHLGHLFPGSQPDQAGRMVWDVRFSGTYVSPGGPAQPAGATPVAIAPNHSMSVVVDFTTGDFVLATTPASSE